MKDPRLHREKCRVVLTALMRGGYLYPEDINDYPGDVGHKLVTLESLLRAKFVEFSSGTSRRTNQPSRKYRITDAGNGGAEALAAAGSHGIGAEFKNERREETCQNGNQRKRNSSATSSQRRWHQWRS